MSSKHWGVEYLTIVLLYLFYDIVLVPIVCERNLLYG